MNRGQALAAFGALSQDTRLSIVRLLVKAGPEGIPAGEVADEIGVSASNLSFHLKELTHAGLASARRDARSIIYQADYDALRNLIGFLMMDCCAGRPEICAPISGASMCCPPSKAKRKRRVHA
jgi:DNA-binding transcriptional ArsR family regulator